MCKDKPQAEAHPGTFQKKFRVPQIIFNSVTTEVQQKKNASNNTSGGGGAGTELFPLVTSDRI